MATFTYPTDKNRLIRALNLEGFEYQTNSTLEILMRNAEAMDAVDHYDRVGNVLNYLSKLDAPNGLLDQQDQQQDNVIQVTVSGEYSVRYAPGGQINKIVMRIQTAKQNILRVLDPTGLLLYDRFKPQNIWRGQVYAPYKDI